MNSNNSQQLFTKPILALIAIVLIGFLLLLFPWKSASFLDKQAPSNLKEQFSSRLLTKYHEALRQTDLTNPQALLLASQLTQKGLWKQSGELLNEKLKQPTLSDEQKKQLSTIQLRNYLDAYYTAAASGEDFDNTQQNVRQHLQDLEDYQNLSNNELIALAKASTNFGLLPQAVKIYSRLAEVDIPQQAKWLAEAGRWSAHAGDPVSAAKAFKAASRLVSGSDHYNAYTYAWLKAANKAGQRDEVKAFLDEARYPLPSSVNALVLLANASLEAGLPESASDLFGHLAKQDSPENAQRWLEKAAHWAAETKSYAKAVNYLKQAHELTSVDSDHWSINQRMIEFYVKDEQPDAALAIISPMIKANPSSVSLLKKGIELSILEKDIPMARRWNQRYLAMQPKSLDALIGRADIETLDEDFPTANNYIKRAVKIAPKDFKLRERWAYLEETQGNEKLALQLWQWMHEQTNKAKYQQQIIRMAQTDLQGKGLPLLLKLSQKTELPTQAVSDVFFHLSKQKDNTKAEQFILNHMEQYGTDQKLMQNLAQWYGSKKRYPEALTTWNSIEKRYGLNSEQNLLRFELYWATEDTDRTFQLWRNHHTQWVALAKPHQLAIMAEVTWRYQQPRSSLAYYKTLLKLTPKQKPKARIFYHTRIALLHNNLKQYPQALSAFKRGFMETADADLLLNGLQATLDAKQYTGFNQLLELSREQTSLFAKNPRYWLMQAAVASQQLQYAQALPLYNKALVLQPDSKEALAGIKSINTVLADANKQTTLKQLVAMQDAFDAKDHRLLASLLKASEAKLAAFADLEQYWLIRSQFHFQQKQFSQAISDYQALLKLKPDSIPARQGIILGLTQLKDYTSLQRALTRWEGFAENNDALWPNYAIAYQAMQQYQASVKWFEMASIKHPENYAMLLSYAESLDKLKRPADAQKVRAFGVTQLSQRLRENTLTPIERKEALFQYLSVLSKVGTQAQFDQTYAELDQTTQSKPDKDRLNEIAIAWALDKNNLNQLRRLLARNDVKQMNKPLWMSLSIALKLKDKAGLIAVLKQSDKLSTSNHISALLALGRKQRAFEVAKQAMRSGKTQKSRRDAKKIAISLADGRVSEVVATLSNRRVGSLSTAEQSLQYKQGRGSNGLPIGYDITLRKATLSNNRLPGKAVDEKDISIGFDWAKTTNQLNARAGMYDNGEDSQLYGSLKYQKQLNARSTAGFEYGFQETPEENAYLRQFGRRNRFKLDYYNQIGDKQAVQLSAWKQAFDRTDNGQLMADGVGARAALVHRENTLNGQWYGGVQGTLQKNTNAADISAEDALPDSLQSAELIAGFNHGTPGQGYAGGLQYSGSVAVGKVWPTGETKAHVEAAVSTELFNNDELSLGVFYDKGSLGEQEDKGLTLKYRKFLDFPVSESK